MEAFSCFVTFFLLNRDIIPRISEVFSTPPGISAHGTSPILVCIILGHLALALWEGGMSPFPLHPAVAAAEACVALCYAAHILLNLWTFGVKQYR